MSGKAMIAIVYVVAHRIQYIVYMELHLIKNEIGLY